MFAFYPFFHMQISRQKFTITPFLLQYLISRDEMRSANLALISGRQMHRMNVCILLVRKLRILAEYFLCNRNEVSYLHKKEAETLLIDSNQLVHSPFLSYS